MEQRRARRGVLRPPRHGAVLHTLNLRLPAHQLRYVIQHADDRVIIVNGSVLPLLAPLLPGLDRVEHIVVSGPGDLSLLAAPGPASTPTRN